MSQPQPHDPAETPPVRCPYCSASLPKPGPACWLCHAPLNYNGEVPLAQKADEPPNFAQSRLTFSLASLMAVMTLVAVGFGLAMWKPGLGILFGWVSIPALIITVTRSRNEKLVKGRNVSLVEKVLTFVVSSMFVVSMMVLMSLALVIALFVVCWIVLIGSGI